MPSCRHCGLDREFYPSSPWRCKECIKAYTRQRYHDSLAKSRLQARKRMRRRREAGGIDPKKQALWRRRWLEKHPEHVYSRLEGAGISADQWQILLDTFGWKCAYCDCDLDFHGDARSNPNGLHLDHWVSAASGGLYEFGNLVPACSGCNHAKHARDPREFVADEDRYEAILTMLGDAEYAS